MTKPKLIMKNGQWYWTEKSNNKIRPNYLKAKGVAFIKPPVLDPQFSDIHNFSFNCQGKLKYYGNDPKYWRMSAYNPETYNE
jgi:hypothetical protein